MRLLIEGGADVTIRVYWGLTAAEVARSEGRPGLADLIDSLGAKDSEKPRAAE